MPPSKIYPGLYVAEIPDAVHAIEGVPTSIAAFIGTATQGPTETPTTLHHFAGFTATFGALSSSLGLAVRDFFVNGGSVAVVVRLAPNAADGVLALADFLPVGGEASQRGLYALEKAEFFNLLCLPPYRAEAAALDIDVELVTAAAAYCEKRRAMLILDAPKDWTNPALALAKFNDGAQDHVGTRSRNAALYFPRLRQPNPLHANQLETMAACGAVAGIFARTDEQRGVWKAPAGLETPLLGVEGLSIALTDADNTALNAFGINALRTFPTEGSVVWGARTLHGADDLADEYKYIPVRRLALFIEESLARGLRWAALEPNAEPLWSKVRQSTDAFLDDLFRRGAFPGATAREGWFVKCDLSTMTQDDLEQGRLVMIVGFAPLRRAEFVTIRYQAQVGPAMAPPSGVEILRRFAQRLGLRDLAGEALARLQGLATQARHRLEGSVTALFLSETSRGRHQAAEAVAHELQRPLYRVDVSAVVVPTVAEANENLRRLFNAASRDGAILFFDEADALFGQRNEVEDASERYAAFQSNFLLQQLESYEGLVILASSPENNLDPAFLQRLGSIIHLPSSDED